MRIAISLTVLALTCTTAMPQDKSTPFERALSERVGKEMNTNLACSTNIFVLQDRVRELEAKLAETEKKSQPQENK